MRAFQMNKLWWFFGYLGLIIIMIGSLMPSDPGPPPIPNLDKILHFTGYAISTFYFQQLTKNKKLVLIFTLLFLYSGLIELLQDFQPTRQMSFFDLVANTMGCTFGTFLSIKVFSNFLSKLDESLSGLLSRS